MKIIVLHEREHGDLVETLELPAGVSWEVVEGKHLHRLRGSNGFEHFFTPDGYYDGWGTSTLTSSDEADEFLKALEEKRRYKEASRRAT